MCVCGAEVCFLYVDAFGGYTADYWDVMMMGLEMCRPRIMLTTKYKSAGPMIELYDRYHTYSCAHRLCTH